MSARALIFHASKGGTRPERVAVAHGQGLMRKGRLTMGVTDMTEMVLSE